MTSLHSKSQAGFTLVELLVTVTILVISLTIGIINYLRFLDKQKLYQSGSNIEAMIKDARSKAQNGFLGSEDIGFCAKLSAVEAYSVLSVDASSEEPYQGNNLSFVSQIRCSNGDLLVYDNYLISKNETLLDQNFKVSFLPIGGAIVSIGGVEVSSGSAVLSSNGSKVIFNLDQGGTVDVRYE